MRCGIYVRVSTDDQRDNGYSIDSQLRMIKEYCEKNNYDIVDVYNDAGHSGKDLMRPEMQRLLKDIKSHKIEVIVAIKVDRLTRNNYDGFWLLNYCEEHDVKIELILEPYDVSIANGEMIFGMNLVFGQRERKEIRARTKRAMEEMALEKVYPAKAPYGYIRNVETGHLEVEPIEAQVVKEIFELCKQGNSSRGIATVMKNSNAYLKTGKWTSDRVYKILSSTNSFKYSGTPKEKVYYHLTCKNPNCKSKGLHYSSDKIEQKLARVLNELTRYMYEMDSEIIVCNSTKTKDIKDIEKAIEKLKMQEKKLVDLYLSSTLNVETINHKNDVIKKEIENLNKKKQQIDPNNDFKEYTIELLKKLDCNVENGKVISNNKIAFTFIFNSLKRKTKQELIKKLIDCIEIKRDKNYDIEITNVKFTEEFISKSTKNI